MKLSGVAIVLASVQEDNHKLQAAYTTYASAYEHLQTVPDRSGPEKVRAGALAYKLGQLAELRRMPREERSWYEAACKELLGAAGLPEQRGEKEKPVDMAELSLPTWVGKVQIVEPLRALASRYTKDGDHQYVFGILLVTHILWLTRPSL